MQRLYHSHTNTTFGYKIINPTTPRAVQKQGTMIYETGEGSRYPQRSSNLRNAEVCNKWNYNTNGCHFLWCKRLHQCSACRSEQHSARKCKATEAKEGETPKQAN